MTPEAFSQALEKCGIRQGARVLAAVSGGADSLCLLWLLVQIRHEYPLEVECAHAEHGLRGSASLEDLEFVRNICSAWGVPFHTEHLNVPAHREIGSTEEAARVLRYAFLRRIAAESGCSCILTAHHRGDQAETVLMRAVRGTDIRGLSAMAAREGDLARPLLDCTPEELRACLQEHGICWREDDSNLDTSFSRNRIRHLVMPELEKVAPGAEQALCRLAGAAARDESFFDGQLLALQLDRPIRLADGAAIGRSKAEGLHPALASRALVRLITAAGAQQDARLIERSLEILAQQSRDAVLNLPGNGRLCFGEQYICAVFPGKPIPVTAIVPGETRTPFGRFILRRAESSERGDGKNRQELSDAMIRGLTVGTRLPGETMVPFGKHKPQEIRKLISDAGVEPAMRRSVPVLRNRQGAVWLAGLRPSELCRLDGAPEWILEYEGARG